MPISPGIQVEIVDDERERGVPALTVGFSFDWGEPTPRESLVNMLALVSVQHAMLAECVRRDVMVTMDTPTDLENFASACFKIIFTDEQWWATHREEVSNLLDQLYQRLIDKVDAAYRYRREEIGKRA